MKVQYFKDTDTLYIEFRAKDIFESRDLDENTILHIGHSFPVPRYGVTDSPG